MRYEEFVIEGRNAVIEAFRAGKTIDKLFVLEHCKEGSMNTVLREAKKQGTVINYVKIHLHLLNIYYSISILIGQE